MKKTLYMLGVMTVGVVTSVFPAAAGWQNVNGFWTYTDASQNTIVNDWVQDNGNWYYMDENGIMKTGWIEIDGKSYYMDPDSGVMKTGWVQDNNEWYYLHSDGTMATGEKVNDNQFSYYFDTTGKMVRDTEIDGVYYGSDGVETSNIFNESDTEDYSESVYNSYSSDDDSDNNYQYSEGASIFNEDGSYTSGGTTYVSGYSGVLKDSESLKNMDLNDMHDENVDGLLELINKKREKNGLKALEIDDTLCGIAEKLALEASENFKGGWKVWNRAYNEVEGTEFEHDYTVSQFTHRGPIYPKEVMEEMGYSEEFNICKEDFFDKIGIGYYFTNDTIGEYGMKHEVGDGCWGIVLASYNDRDSNSNNDEN